MQEKLSVLIITYNEEKNIDALISNIDFADEIIIVDSFSTDKTIDLLKKYKHVKVYQHKFENFSIQRNHTLKYAKHPWVLVLDADERLSDSLKKEIIKTINAHPKENGFYIKRSFYFKEQLIHFTGLKIDKNLRLFKKNGVKYYGIVHEKPTVAKPIGILKNPLWHYSYKSYKHFYQKISYYNKLKALEKFNKKQKPNIFKAFLHPFYTFFSRYIIRLGILDGKRGMLLSYIFAKGVADRYKEWYKLLKNTHNK